MVSSKEQVSARSTLYYFWSVLVDSLLVLKYVSGYLVHK